MKRFTLIPGGLVLAILLIGLSNAAQETKKKPAAKITPVERMKLLKTFNSEFVMITPGKGRFPDSFMMGTAQGDPGEQPAHQVKMRSAFAIAKYEVPQNLWEAVMGENPSRWKGPRNSVEMLSWQDAVVFCRKTTAMLRQLKLIEANEVIRLPSEAEWEYCCRAGSTTAYSFGDKAQARGDVGKKASLLDPYGWHNGNAAGNDPPVGAKKPNAWGLYDVHGYLWEFVSDHWHPDYKTAPGDGSSWDDQKPSAMRVIRSGSWRDQYPSLRSAVRIPILDHAKSDAIGLRCVKSVTGQDKKK